MIPGSLHHRNSIASTCWTLDSQASGSPGFDRRSIRQDSSGAKGLLRLVHSFVHGFLLLRTSAMFLDQLFLQSISAGHRFAVLLIGTCWRLAYNLIRNGNFRRSNRPIDHISNRTIAMIMIIISTVIMILNSIVISHLYHDRQIFQLQNYISTLFTRLSMLRMSLTAGRPLPIMAVEVLQVLDQIPGVFPIVCQHRVADDALNTGRHVHIFGVCLGSVSVRRSFRLKFHGLLRLTVVQVIVFVPLRFFDSDEF